MRAPPLQALALLLCAIVLILGSARAQDTGKTRLEVHVTAIQNGSLWIDRGRAAGLEVGDRVTFFPAGSASVEGTIRSVAKNSARVELDPGSSAVKVEDRGQVDVPRERLAAGKVEPAKPEDKPAHPPWSRPPESWSTDKPLLAPAFGIPPEERDREIHGRFFAQGTGTWDNQGGTRKYYFGNLGVDASMDNPFGAGGSLRLDAQLFSRTADSDTDEVHDSETRLVLRRFAYEVGGGPDRPTRWQIGRFLQHEFPELGWLDGVEWSQRLAGGSRVGASVGAMPEPFPDFKSFEDLQAAAFYRLALGDKQQNLIGLAYQSTWHKGDPDRNLFLATADLRPADAVSVHGAAWIDYYTASDRIKDEGLELTELLVSGTWRATTSSGLGLSYSRRKLPELLRAEFQAVSADRIKDDELDRIALNGWLNAGAALRFDGRVDHWRDQDDSGTTSELGAALRDVLWRGGELRAAAFYAEGSFSSGPGFRVQATKGFGRVYANLGYEYVDFEQKDFTGQQQKLGQHSVFASLDLPLSAKTDLSLLGEDHFGDQQDAYTLGFLLQTRF